MRRIIWDYIFDETSLIFLVAILIFIIIRLLYLLIAKKTFFAIRELMLLIFVASIIFIISKTVIPKYSFAKTSDGLIVNLHRLDWKVNIIPFKTIWYFMTDEIKRDSVGMIINILGNLLLFIPIGLAGLALNQYDIRLTVMKGCIISVIIEIIQIIPGRSTDIDDVIVNTIGVLIGCLIMFLIHKISVRFKKE